MKASKTILVAVLTVGSVGFATANALACHGGYGYSSSYSSNYYAPEYVHREYVREAPVTVVAPSLAPAHSLVIVTPGDSWFSVCAREYGNSGPWSKVAQFNGMPANVQLTPGMQLRLPVINPDGSFSMSSAPAAIAMPQQAFAGGFPQGLPQGGQPGPQGGLPQVNGFAPQGQGFAPQQLSMGQPQGAPTGPQGGVPQGQQVQQPGPQGQPLGQQMQQVAPQGPTGPQGGIPQVNGIAPQGQQFGQQMQQAPPQGPVAPQGPEVGPKNGDSIVQRIADELMSLPGVPAGQPAAPNAGPTGRPLPSIVIGSIMTINGQPLGDGRGTVRLIVNGSPVALEIVEWTAMAAKVRVPADLPAGLQVQIEILRADGGVVTKDAVQLAAGQQVAAAK
jgi:hypothetical protein